MPNSAIRHSLALVSSSAAEVGEPPPAASWPFVVTLLGLPPALIEAPAIALAQYRRQIAAVGMTVHGAKQKPRLAPPGFRFCPLSDLGDALRIGGVGWKSDFSRSCEAALRGTELS